MVGRLFQDRSGGVKLPRLGDLGRAGAISLMAICLPSVSGCFLPRDTPVGGPPIKVPPIIEEQLTVEEQLTIEEWLTVMANEEVDEEKRAWHAAVWDFAVRWGGFLRDRLFDAWGLTKEAGALAIKYGINYAAIAYEYGIGYANAIIRISAATIDSVVSSAAYQKALAVVSNPAIFLDAYGRLSRYAKNLDWNRVNPIPYLIRGTRGVPRTLEQARAVWETIPRAIRAAGPAATARYLATRDWSHVYPYSLGGSNDPRNGIFENRYLNRARGSAIMTPGEYRAAQISSRSYAFQVTLQQAAQGAVKGGVVSAAVLAVVAVLELGLQYQQGEITANEMYLEIGKTIAAAGVTGAAISGLVTAMALAFPAIIPVVTVISVPLAIVGLSLLTPKLIKAGKGWYDVFVQESKLRPAALGHWFARRYETVRGFVLGRSVQMDLVAHPLLAQYLVR